MVGNVYVGRILMGLSDKPAKATPEVELEPIVPGAWAAWAKANATPSAAVAPAPKTTTTTAPVKSTLIAAEG